MGKDALIHRVRKHVRAKPTWTVAALKWVDGKPYFRMGDVYVPAAEAVSIYPAARQQAKRMIAELLEKHPPLPDPWEEVLVELLRTDPPSKTRGRQPLEHDPENHSRNYHVCIGVRTLEIAGFNPTAGDDKPKDDTGCGIVADALNLSYEAIATIWSQRERHFKYGIATNIVIERLIDPESCPL